MDVGLPRPPPRPPPCARASPAAPRRVGGGVVVVGGGGSAEGPSPRTPTTGSDQLLEAHRSQVDPFDAQIDLSRLESGYSVGTGDTAEVFVGTYIGEVVAIKQFFRHKKLCFKEEISFNREVAVLRQITHENLVKFYGVFYREQPFRIITELCEGGSCFDLIHTAAFKLSWAQREKIIADTACGMNYLHSFSPMIIHRDLKSLNLLLEAPVRTSSHVPYVKISDFGLSRMKDPCETCWGKMTAQVGTLHWMAPEVFSGSEYDESVDIYSYAMVMFEALCDQVPFQETDPGIIGELTVQGVRPKLDSVSEDCPPRLTDLMVLCWAGDPKRRPTFVRIVEVLCGLAGSPSAGTSPRRSVAPPGAPPGSRRPSATLNKEVLVSRTRATAQFNSVSL